jgi:ABC-type methionine transport system ATPase subunit
VNIRVRLVFPEPLVKEPILSRLVRSFDVDANIRRASVDEDGGWIICELVGSTASLEEAMAWLEGSEIHVEQLDGVVEG